MNKLFYPIVIAVFLFANIAHSQINFFKKQTTNESEESLDSCKYKIGLLSGKVICSTTLTENKIDNNKKGYLATADGKEYSITQVSYFQKPEGYYKYLTYMGSRQLFEREIEGKICTYTNSFSSMPGMYYSPSGGFYGGGGGATIYVYEVNNNGIPNKLKYSNLKLDLSNCKSCQQNLKNIKYLNIINIAVSLVGIGVSTAGIISGSNGNEKLMAPLFFGGVFVSCSGFWATMIPKKKEKEKAIYNYNEEFK